MVWIVVFCAVASAVCLGVYYIGPQSPQQIAEPDLDLVREEDRTAWRKVSLRMYKSWKHQDDFYRVAAYKQATDSGLSASDAKAVVKRDFPFYYHRSGSP